MSKGDRTADTACPSTIRAFLVDDHLMFLESLVRVFRDEPGIDVVGTEGTLGAALDRAPALAPDVVIMDFQLPDGDGVEGSRQMLERLPGTSVLLLTGDDDPQVVARAVEAGCMGFLTKDRAISDLVAAVRSLAAGDAYIPGDLLAAILPRVGRAPTGVGSDLTAREIDVLRLAATGHTNQVIANELFLSVNTVRNHVQNSITKLGAHSKLEAVTIALRARLIALSEE